MSCYSVIKYCISTSSIVSDVFLCYSVAMKAKVNIYDIARHAGVSPATVSRALNHPEMVSLATLKRIQDASTELSFQKRKYAGSQKKQEPLSPAFRPAALQSHPNHHFLISIPSASNPFYTDIIEGAARAASNEGCHLFVDYVRITPENLRISLEAIASLYAGMIVLEQLSDDLLLRIRSRLPLVQCSNYSSSLPQISSVSIDDEDAEHTMTQYILSRGCRDIAFLAASPESAFFQKRLRGLKMALARESLNIPPERIVYISGFEFPLAYDAAVSLLSSGSRPDAVICISDVFAAACVKACHTLGIRIPEDILIAGFDDVSLAVTTTPSITTIAQPRFQLGFNAMTILLQETRTPQLQARHLVLPTRLIIRESTE